MPYNFSKDPPCDPETLTSMDWRILRRINIFGLLFGSTLVSFDVWERIQKQEYWYLISPLLFGAVWVVFFLQNIWRATAWMRTAKRKEIAQTVTPKQSGSSLIEGP